MFVKAFGGLTAWQASFSLQATRASFLLSLSPVVGGQSRLRPFSEFNTMPTNHLSETAPLLAIDGQDVDELTPCESNPKVRRIVWGALTLLFVAALVLLVGFQGIFGDPFAEWLGVLPKDPMLAALVILDRAPVIVRDSLLLVMV
jgi:hypothetical protein